MTVTTPYGDLAKKIHKTATDKGFWEDDRNLGEMLMLAISECSEALEEHRDGKPDVYYKHTSECSLGISSNYVCICTPKPEGLAIELADCMIRCLDTLQHFYQETGKLIDDVRAYNRTPDPVENLGDQLRIICKYLANGADNNGEVDLTSLTIAFLLCEELLKRLGHDPDSVILVKMAYNETRPYKHGKKY